MPTDAWLILAGALGTIFGASVTLLSALLQSRTQQRTVRLQLEHERQLAETNRRAAIEAEWRKHERDALTEIVKSTDPYELEVLQLAQQIDDVVLLRMAARDAPISSIQRRAGYLLRTPTGERTIFGHTDPFRNQELTFFSVSHPPAVDPCCPHFVRTGPETVPTVTRRGEATPVRDESSE